MAAMQTPHACCCQRAATALQFSTKNAMSLVANARDTAPSSSPSPGTVTAMAVSGLPLLCCKRCPQLLLC